MKAISYVASPDLVLELLEKWGYEQILVLVGENDSGLGLARNFRQGLSDHRDVAERLLRWVERGTLQILIPPRTIHTKLYILRDSQRVRVVMTSANLTQVARSARRQVNYAWYLDVSPDDRWLVHVSSDFDSQCKGSELFMGDLLSLLRSVEGADRNETVEAWLTGGASARATLRPGAFFAMSPQPFSTQNCGIKNPCSEFGSQRLMLREERLNAFLRLRNRRSRAVRFHFKRSRTCATCRRITAFRSCVSIGVTAQSC